MTNMDIKSRQYQLLGLILLSAIIVLLHTSITSFAQDFPDVCQQSENILPNCNFSNGLDHWQTFTEAGSAHFSVLQGGGECHAPLCPAAYIVTEDHFVGGLYQQVQVANGNNYYANIVWLVFDSLVNDAGAHNATGGIGRRIGVDPFGGTDPGSSNIVWSEDNWRNDCKICNVEHVTVTAQAETITVFLRLDDTWRLRAAEKGIPVPPSRDKFWIDDIGLKQIGGEAIVVQAPTETPLPPTETPLPPTETPLPPTTEAPLPPPTEAPPTDLEPIEESDDQPEAVAEIASPVETPVGTQPPVQTPAPPPTLTPTTLPSPTPIFTRRPRQTPTPLLRTVRNNLTEEASPELPMMMGAIGVTVCIGGMAILLVGAVMAGLVWLYRLGWGDITGDDDEFNEMPENHDPVSDDELSDTDS